MTNKILIIIPVIILVGCTRILMITNGIKNPEIENEESILKKAIKYDFDTTNIVTVNSNDYISVVKQQGIPDAGIYDSNGKYIEYREADTSCNAGLFQFIPEMSLTGTYNQPDSATLDQELAKFRNLKGQPLIKPGPADFYILIYWAAWTGKLNKDHVKAWEGQARENKNCHIEVILVNLDLQSYWEEKEQKRIMEAIFNTQ